jgi:hypothetical protein
VKKRLAFVLLLLAVGLLASLFAWPYVGERLRTAELTLAAVSQPRAEVVVSGYVKNVGAAPFSLETLMIEEPGREPYPRQVALDANRSFELALGKTSAGTYRVAVKTRKRQWGQEAQEGWLKTPALILTDRNSTQPQMVRVKDYDYPRLFEYAAIAAVAVAGLALVWLRPGTRSRVNDKTEPQV